MADTNQSERDLFEATLGGSRVLMRATDDSYVSMYVQNDWEVWQVARATLATPAPVAPAGFKLVPIEATEAMKAAAVIYANGNAVYKNVKAEVLRIEEGIYGEVFEAMIAAAPVVEEREWLKCDACGKDMRGHDRMGHCGAGAGEKTS